MRLRLLCVRRDGAVACLLDASPCTNAGILYHEDTIIEGLQPVWAHNQAALLGNPALVFLDEHDGAAVVTWTFVLLSGMMDAQEHGGLCRECKLCLSCERIDGVAEPPSHEELLYALTHSLRWVAPGAAVAQATHAAARLVEQRARDEAAATAIAAHQPGGEADDAGEGSD